MEIEKFNRESATLIEDVRKMFPSCIVTTGIQEDHYKIIIKKGAYSHSFLFDSARNSLEDKLAGRATIGGCIADAKVCLKEKWKGEYE